MTETPFADDSSRDPQSAARGELLPPTAGDAANLAGAGDGSSPGPGRDGAALAHWLEQTHRDAAANRAQSRELIRTLEQVRDSHEYVGKALREEQTRNRRLTAALVLAPILAGLLVWGVWSQMDALRSDLSRQVGDVAAGQAELRRTQDGLRLSEAADAQRTRAEALEAELDRVRNDLEGIRSETARQDQVRASETVALRARLAELEEESAAAAALRAQIGAMRSRTGVEAARSAELEREVRRLERELGAEQSGGPRSAATGASPGPRATPPRTDVTSGTSGTPPAGSTAGSTAERPSGTGAGTGATPPAETATGSTTRPAAPKSSGTDPAAYGPRQPQSDAREPTATIGVAAAAASASATGPDAAAGAVRRPEDLERIKKELNRLLALSADKVGYRVDMVGGVRGETLLDVRFSGVDARGRVVRSLDAPTATVRVRAADGEVHVDLRDGHLILAGRRAPFFDGRYAIVMKSDAAAWRTSGLNCVVFE